MINEKNVKRSCCEDISLIENYDKAINDKTQTWDLHHRLETDLGLSRQELIDTGRYYKVEAKYLIFLTKSEHRSLHNSVNFVGENNPFYGNHRFKGENHPMYGKKQKIYKWLTPDGEIKEMYKTAVIRFHPDWIMIKG